MNLNVSLQVFIKEGLGELQFPEVFKRSPLQVHIGCDSMWFIANPTGHNELCFIICCGSFYYTRNREQRPNILGMFQNKTTANMVNFLNKIPITSAQETLEIEIVDFHNKRLNISALAVFHLEGSVKNQLLTI